MSEKTVTTEAEYLEFLEFKKTRLSSSMAETAYSDAMKKALDDAVLAQMHLDNAWAHAKVVNTYGAKKAWLEHAEKLSIALDEYFKVVDNEKKEAEEPAEIPAAK